MKLSFIIPNYNGSQLLKKNLPAVFKAAVFYHDKTGNDFEIIIPDDASSDDSPEVISGLPFPVRFMQHTKNVGFASNVNRGVSEAKGEILVLLNSDVHPDEEFLMPLIKHFEEQDVAAVGCLDRSVEHDKEIKRGRGIGRWERGFLLHSAGDVTKKDTLWVSGGSSAFRRSTWEEVGGLYQIYNPFYWEDIDLSYRILKSGFRIVFEPESQVTHEHELGAIKSHFTQRKITSVAYRNQILFVWLNITDPGFLISHFLWLPLHGMQSLMRLDLPFFSGFFSALCLLPDALKLRKRNKNHFKRGDLDVIAVTR